MMILTVAIPTNYKPDDGGPVYRSLYGVHVNHGGHSAFSACSGDQGYAGLGKRRASCTGHDRVLESHHHVVEGKSAFATVNCKHMADARPAPASMAIFPPLGSRRWDRPTREHGTMHGEQLQPSWVLASLASELQPLDRAVYIRAAWGSKESGGDDVGGVYVRSVMARSKLEAPCVGLVGRLVRDTGDGGGCGVPGLQGTSVNCMRTTLDVDEEQYGAQGWWRHLCAAGAVLNILMLMIANLVGFVVGVDGTRLLLERLLGTWDGVQFMILSCGGLWIGAQLMFEYR
jgi:hypothetical protein